MYQVFVGKNSNKGKKVTGPLANVNRGQIRINSALYSAMGQPEYIEYLHDTDARRWAIRPINQQTAASYKVRTSKSGAAVVSCGAFLNSIGVDNSSRKLNILNINGIVEFEM